MSDSNIVQAVLDLGQLKEDRSVGIMASALLEYWLGRAIFSRLREMDSDEQDKLLDNNGHGALATFSAKIWVGFALNLYQADARKDLANIKNVRNMLAHAYEHIDFSNKEIVTYCDKLTAPKRLAETSGKAESKSAKERYLDSVHYFAASFNLYSKLDIKRPAAPNFIQY